jgi:hypothetical protein
MKKIILETLNSPLFKDRLISINENYPNLKQENVIKNSVLELLNDQFKSNNPSLKAFAEHPRAKNSRVDLSIINYNSLTTPYLVEFKFQYTNDFKQFLNYKSFIDNDFQRAVCDKQSDLFILIVSHWTKSEKHEFDHKWGLTSNLSRFLSHKEEWKDNLNKLFCEYPNVKLDELSITVAEPYETNYNFFIISREEVEYLGQELSKQDLNHIL